MWRPFATVTVLAIAGCGPSARELREREQTLSTLNTEADRWEGGKEFATAAVDAYGRPLTATIEKGPINFTLTLRSAGPDGLPKNSDDIVVVRSKPHGESSYTKEAAKAVEAVAGGVASGTVQGVKKGLGLGGGDKK